MERSNISKMPVTWKPPAMDKAVAQLNVEHYRKLLCTETDLTKRATLGRLLAEEQAKLAVLMNNVARKPLTR